MNLPDADIITTTARRAADTLRLHLNPVYLFMDAELKQLPETWNRGEGTTLHEGRNTVRRMRLAGVDVAVKRYKRLGGLKRLIYTFFRPTKAIRGLVYSLEYRRRDIPSPEGIAAIEILRGGMVVDCYLVTVMSRGRNLFPELVPVEDYDRNRVSNLADFLVTMHRRGVMNTDTNLSNLLVDATPATPFECIDINRSVFTAENFSYRSIVRNLARVTHRRDLLLTIVMRYATTAGLHPQAMWDDVAAELDRFERKIAMRNRFKTIFRKKRTNH
ncbi:MAG: hypothetical protein J1E63_02160 [Muribaculaceae bacterium]|nr:hypothetical protein [Muribaculaceae bacterium]